MPKEKITLEKLASIVENGFKKMNLVLAEKSDKTDIGSVKQDIDSVKQDIANLANATKLGFDEVHEKLDTKASKSDIDGIKQRLSNLDYRFDTVATHERRVLRLEKEVHFV